MTPSDYLAFGRPCPTTNPSIITAIADTDAQSCLWSMSGFLAAGFSAVDLLPVSVDLTAANKTRIEITGAVVLRLSASSSANDRQSCATMVYVSPAAHGFYLSCEAMVDLGIVPVDFPSIGPLPRIPASAPSIDGPPGPRNQQDCGLRASNAGCVSALAESDGPCSCPPRTIVPNRPTVLPFDCTEANNAKMKAWLLQEFASSTFNTCPHRPLPCMAGPPVEIHLKEGATPKAVPTPALIPVHWQERVPDVGVSLYIHS